jgi:chromosome segregation ATPase
MSEKRTITADEAKAAREALKAYRAAQAAECAARKERRAERAHDMALFKALEQDSQKAINQCQQDLDAYAEKLKAIREQLRALRETVAGLESERRMALMDQSRAYEDRARARERLREYSAEIRTGVKTDDADDTDAADAEALMCEAEYRGDARKDQPPDWQEGFQEEAHRMGEHKSPQEV